MSKSSGGEMRRLFLTATLVIIFGLHVCHGDGQMTASSVDMGRAKAKISAEEMLKLHRKRRDDDKLFSINSPRKNEKNQVQDFLNFDAYLNSCHIISCQKFDNYKEFTVKSMRTII